MPIPSILLAAVAFVFGSYEVIYGFWTYQKNGFWFYWVAGLLIGIPFIMVTLLLTISPVFRTAWLEGGVLLVWLAGELWKVWMKRRARRVQPERWAAWERVLNDKPAGQKN